jgi:hypothetical protein
LSKIFFPKTGVNFSGSLFLVSLRIRPSGKLIFWGLLGLSRRGDQVADRSTTSSFVMNPRANNGALVKSTVLVAVALSMAILLAVSFLIAAGTRGGDAWLSRDPVTTSREK